MTEIVSIPTVLSYNDRRQIWNIYQTILEPPAMPLLS